MTEERLKYFGAERKGIEPYMNDLAHNKLHIYEVPFQYRTKSAYIEAFNANVAVWDGSEQTNRFRLETELIAQQARNDIMEAVKLGLHSRAESIKMFYIEFFYNYPFKDKNGRRYCYDGGYTQD